MTVDGPHRRGRHDRIGKGGNALKNRQLVERTPLRPALRQCAGSCPRSTLHRCPPLPATAAPQAKIVLIQAPAPPQPRFTFGQFCTIERQLRDMMTALGIALVWHQVGSVKLKPHRTIDQFSRPTCSNAIRDPIHYYSHHKKVYLNMINWLHTLSNLGIGVLIVSFGLAVSTLVPFYIRWHFHLEPGEHVAKGAEESFKLFTSVNMLLLAFCLVRVQGDHRTVEDLVSREATIIFKLNRALAGFGGDDAVKLRENLKLYATSTVNVEWPLLANGQRSEETSDLLSILVQGCRELDPKTPLQQLARAEVLGTLTQMSDVREARLSASRLFLPIYFWQALLSAIALLTVFGWFQSPLPKMFAYVGGVTLGVSLLLTVLITTEGIFVGESRVTAEAITRILPSLSD